MRSFVVAVVLVAACTHERMLPRNGCWVAYRESRWGDTNERIVACRPAPPRWSEDPLVRAIEDCLHQAQLAQYQRAVRGKEDPTTSSDEAACLEQAQKLALERLDRLKAEVQAAEARTRRLQEENRELRQTLVACVEKTPNAVAEAHATSENSSDFASSQNQDHAGTRRAGTKRAVVRTDRVCGNSSPSPPSPSPARPSPSTPLPGSRSQAP